MRGPLLLVCAVLATGCGRTDASHLDAVAGTPRAHWEELAPTCAGYPAKADCDDGDMVLFGGLLCASGDERGCALVRDSQGTDGQWWRSPRRNPGNLGSGKSFSRDMAMGVLLYLTTTHDAPAAASWLDWIENNRPCLTQKPGGGCLIRGPRRYCRDEENQSCTLTPGNWALMSRVWEELGLAPSSEMRLYAGVDAELLPIQADTAPLGYETHLPAVETLLKARLGTTPTLRAKAARILAEKQPDNPFFVYLRDGASPALAGRLLSLCPQPGDDARGGHQWAWERATDAEAWKDSMGWDCLFLGNLLGVD